MRDPRVFVNLAEQVLTVDEVERPTPKGDERESSAFHLSWRNLCHDPDYVSWAVSVGVEEAFADTVESPRPWNNEICFRKVEQIRVIHVDGILERQERPERWDVLEV
jgi:hypothetical protein